MILGVISFSHNSSTILFTYRYSINIFWCCLWRIHIQKRSDLVRREWKPFSSSLITSFLNGAAGDSETFFSLGTETVSFVLVNTEHSVQVCCSNKLIQMNNTSKVLYVHGKPGGKNMYLLQILCPYSNFRNSFVNFTYHSSQWQVEILSILFLTMWSWWIETNDTYYSM